MAGALIKVATTVQKKVWMHRWKHGSSRVGDLPTCLVSGYPYVYDAPTHPTHRWLRVCT